MLPLAVDLDGTLIRGDLFAMAMLRLTREAPWRLPQLAWWLAHGRAHAKAKLARIYPIDAGALPYNAAFVDWLRQQTEAGRELVLATAFDSQGAEAVAAHLGMFARVFASDGRTNLKSHAKAAALQGAFPDGFVYAGNERADIAVWRAARAAIIVAARPAVLRYARAQFAIEQVFP